MQAIVCKTWGLPDTLVVEDLPDLAPGPGQVAIDVKAAGVNFPDVLIIQNKYQFKPELPFTPGSELAGVVRAVGDGVSHCQPGDKVIAFIGHGAFAWSPPPQSDTGCGATAASLPVIVKAEWLHPATIPSTRCASLRMSLGPVYSLAAVAAKVWPFTAICST